MSGALTEAYRLADRLAALEMPHDGPCWHAASDLLDALVRGSDPHGRYFAHPNLLRRLVWWQEDLPTHQIAAWRDDLVAAGRIEIRSDARSSYGGDPYSVVHLVRRQQYRRFQPRLAIPQQLRHEVYERDGWRCVSCGTQEALSLDHVWPYSLGGEDTLENLQTMCMPCNSRKGAAV
jgi:hypothetical protein